MSILEIPTNVFMLKFVCSRECTQNIKFSKISHYYVVYTYGISLKSKNGNSAKLGILHKKSDIFSEIIWSAPRSVILPFVELVKEL